MSAAVSARARSEPAAQVMSTILVAILGCEFRLGFRLGFGPGSGDPDSVLRYRVEGPLGEGGMGRVLRAFDLELERPVALKRSRRHDPQDLLRFKREFRGVASLEHPGLVKLYELGSDDEGLYYTMEPILGSDLAGYCAGRGDRLLEVLPQLLDALVFLHANGIVHCDLKPANVLVSNDGALKLVDFGVLAELSGAREARVGGTPAYMAPERTRGEPPAPASDAYSLGCTIYDVLAGRPPFAGSLTDVIEAHRSQAPERLRTLAPRAPQALDDLCMALLEKDPARRPDLAAV
ncbi:MAG: serine/threonine protein kinase, partial [Sandaracinaceae bacterium]|nr:serine/threonine protein kinase [Sandaracinaceae bacterium]